MPPWLASATELARVVLVACLFKIEILGFAGEAGPDIYFFDRETHIFSISISRSASIDSSCAPAGYQIG